MNKPTGSTVYRDALPADNRTDKEQFVDSEIARLVPAIKDCLSVDDGWKFQDELDDETCRFGKLIVCRVWRDRVLENGARQNDAIAKLKAALKAQSQAPNAQVFQLRVGKAAQAAIDAGVEVKYSQWGQIVAVDGVQVAETASLLPDLKMDLLAREPLNQSDGRLSPEYAKRVKRARDGR